MFLEHNFFYQRQNKGYYRKQPWQHNRVTNVTRMGSPPRTHINKCLRPPSLHLYMTAPI